MLLGARGCSCASKLPAPAEALEAASVLRRAASYAFGYLPVLDTTRLGQLGFVPAWSAGTTLHLARQDGTPVK